jgi:UDP-sugar pyrophosphorylase
MMQDYPKGLPPSACVGFTVINQVWATYSPVKNSAADARAKAAEGNPTHSATTGESQLAQGRGGHLMQWASAPMPP